MRKYLIAAIAAITAMAFAGVAIAQSQDASMKVTLSPKKAGTKKHPQNSSLKLTITNNDIHKTLRQLDIRYPKTVRLSGKGLKSCNEARLEANSPSGCPKASIAGHGTADAALGVTLDQPVPLQFTVTAVVVGKKGLDFYLHSDTVGDYNARGRIKPRGHKLVVQVPQGAQEPTQGVFAGLVSLTTKLSKHSGKHMLIASTGCKHHKQPFSATLHFATNPVRPASTATAHASARCR